MTFFLMGILVSNLKTAPSRIQLGVDCVTIYIPHVVKGQYFSGTWKSY